MNLTLAGPWLLTADFRVIDPYRMMHTDGSAEKSTRPVVYAWRARVNISATRCSAAWLGRARRRSFAAASAERPLATPSERRSHSRTCRRLRARARVADLRLPWERRYDTGRLTPIRVHRVVSALLAELGMPAKPPKPCGRSPGRPKGRRSGRAKRYPALKKSA
jgi:hypothetical protein